MGDWIGARRETVHQLDDRGGRIKEGPGQLMGLGSRRDELVEEVTQVEVFAPALKIILLILSIGYTAIRIYSHFEDKKKQQDK